MVTAEVRSRAFWAWFAAKHPARAAGEPTFDSDSRPQPAGAATGSVDPRPVAADLEPVRVHRRGWAVSGAGKRRRPRGSTRIRILNLQDHKCLYCRNPFGAIVARRSATVSLCLSWDHFVPYVYARNNPDANWAAACHVCNLIKGPRMFETVDRARAFIVARWAEKGYDIRPLTLRTASEERSR
jgi:5-methylcytosine-specific restriction endonuclease McrA